MLMLRLSMACATCPDGLYRYFEHAPQESPRWDLSL
jgi:hypothetical protein